MNDKEWRDEYIKCKNSAYYFFTTYLKITLPNGETRPFTTHYSEEEFNEKIKKYYDNTSR